MAEKEQIQPIKDIQYSYSSFLWKDLSEIRELQKKGEYYEALWHLLETIDWLPEDFQGKLHYQEKAAEIREILKKIKTTRILEYQKLNDVKEQRNRISANILRSLIPDLSINLDRKGYMERKGGVTTVTKSMKDFQMTVDQARYESEH